MEAKEKPTSEQYERLISVLEENNDMLEKTVKVQEQMIEVLQEMLDHANKELEKQKCQKSYFPGNYFG